MRFEQFVVNINSEHPDELIAFYRDVVGLDVAAEGPPGAFMAGSSQFLALIIESHDAVNGVSSQPHRILLNFFTDDAAREQARIESRGVRFIRPAEREEGFGVVATFADPDGNLCQLMQMDT
jgi:predicted enzyme related to lactoylglutathione lyase